MDQDPIAALIATLDGMQARVAMAGDRPLLRQIVNADAVQMLAGVPASARAVLVSAQVEGRLKALCRDRPGAVTLVLAEEVRAIGLMVLDWPPAGAVALLELLVLPGLRGQGRGSRVLAALCAVAAGQGRALRACLFYESPARRLLARAGFALTAENGTEIALERPATPLPAFA